MREDFLHYLWRLGRFDLRELQTTQGALLSIQGFGTHNTGAGPDFSGAQLRIDGLQWAGNVEMHLTSSEWYAHGHQNDPAYDNVILHVVMEEDQVVFNRRGERIPCLELKGRVPQGLAHTYWRMLNNTYWVACQHQLHRVPELVKTAWLERLLAERLGEKAALIAAQLNKVQRDWEEIFFQSLARSLGGKINSQGMEMLARSLPLRLLLKHKHSRLQTEALLYGQAGLLPTDSEEAYPQQLAREYKLLATKYQLTPLPSTVWRYLRLRPANFPEMRIAQLACLLTNTGQLFGKILAAANLQELENMFELGLSNYWQSHYRFGKSSKRQHKKLGRASIHSILINTVAPFYYLYGQLRGEEAFQEKAMALLTNLPAEENTIMTHWHELGMPVESASRSQALLHLKQAYCDKSRCLSCALGCAILGREGERPLLSVNEETLVYSLTGS